MLRAGNDIRARVTSLLRRPVRDDDGHDRRALQGGLGSSGRVVDGRPDDSVVVRGELESGEFIAFWQRDGRVTAAMNVNVWDVVDELKAIVEAGCHVDAARLSDRNLPLADLVG